MSRGACVLDVRTNIAYFMNYEGEVCSYDISSRHWSELPRYHYNSGSLAVVNGQLTAIGGRKVAGECTDELWSLEGQSSWTNVLKSMPTSRCEVTTVSTTHHLIVAGGTITGRLCDCTTAVEMMNTTTLDWSTVASLRHPHTKASAVLCRSHIYMLGGKDDKAMTKSVLTCSLTELLRSSPSEEVWHSIADAPNYFSTCAAVNGELLAVGGCDKDTEAVNTIHKYNAATSSWDHIDSMPAARYYCLLMTPTNNETVVVGGFEAMGSSTDEVYIATCGFS